jgi:hypothetical protein
MLVADFLPFYLPPRSFTPVNFPLSLYFGGLYP